MTKIVVVCDKDRYVTEWTQCINRDHGFWEGYEILTVLTPDLLEQGWDWHGDAAIFITAPEKAGGTYLSECFCKLGLRVKATTFLINEKEGLSKSEREGVWSEARSALMARVRVAPRIGLFSTAVAACCLSSGEQNTANVELARTLEHKLQGTESWETMPNRSELLGYSGMPDLKEWIAGLQDFISSFDPDHSCSHRPVVALVSGRPNGKSTLASLLRDDERFLVVEAHSPWTEVWSCPACVHADAILFVSDFRAIEEMPDVLPLLRNGKGFLLLNMEDEFAVHGLQPHEYVNECRRLLHQAGIDASITLPVCGLYADLARQKRQGLITTNDLIEMPEVVLTDDWGFPMPKDQYPERIDRMFDSSFGLKQITAKLSEVLDA